MISRTFKLCLNAGNGSAPYINVNQYDEGETWLFELYSENGERYIPSSGAIVGVKSDGHGIVNTGTVDSEGRVVITETQQMTASAGRAIYELSIDGLTHGTANFIVAVERKPTDDAVMSDSDLSLIQEAIDSAEVIVEVIGDGDPSEVIGEHVDAWLDNHPEATTTVEDGAITAPKINQSLWDKLLVNEEASGNPASFSDGADDVPVSSLKVALEPIQTGSGDPSPTNIRPISGHSSVTVERTGKNLFPYASVSGTLSVRQFISLVAGTYTISAVATSTDIDDTRCLVYVHCVDDSTQRLYLSRGNRNNKVLTTTSDIDYIVFYASVDYNKSQGDTFSFTNVQVERGDTATAYEPYTSTSYPYSLGQSVYGGTVDLATGVLTVTHGIVDLGSLTWRYNQANLQAFDTVDIASFVAGGNVAICSAYPVLNVPMTTANVTANDKFFRINKAENGTSETSNLGLGALLIKDTNYSDVESFKTAMSGQQLVYELATPQTIQLTPTEVKTLLGYNNISSTGTVDVIYHADTKLYVDKMTNVDNAIIAPTEEGFTATRNYTTNDLVIVNDTLYKVTANIASGSAITPNSNVQQTTLGALIKALS